MADNEKKPNEKSGDAEELHPEKKFCDCCAFYYSVDGTKGQCRRRAPKIVRGEQFAKFPPVRPDWRCGEWEEWTFDCEQYVPGNDDDLPG